MDNQFSFLTEALKPAVDIHSDAIILDWTAFVSGGVIRNLASDADRCCGSNLCHQRVGPRVDGLAIFYLVYLVTDLVVVVIGRLIFFCGLFARCLLAGLERRLGVSAEER